MSIETSVNLEANPQEIMNFYIDEAELEKTENVVTDEKNFTINQ